MFVEYNANPNGDNIDDCVVRAISKVLDIDYWDVFDGLCKEMDRVGGDAINSWNVFIPYLNNKNYELLELNEKMTVNQFCKYMSSCRDIDEFKCIGLVDGHTTAIIGSDVYDTWDPSSYRLQFVMVQYE